MAIESTRSFQISFSGDISANIIQSALPNAISPARIEIVELVDGNNTISSPSIVDITLPTALTIIPPSGNVVSIILKGVNGDTGIGLNLLDPTTIALGADFVSLVLEVDGDDIPGVQLIWS